LKHFKFGRPPAIALVLRLWLGALQSWNVSKTKFKNNSKIIQKLFFIFFPKIFQSWWGPRHRLGIEAMAGSLPNMKCFKNFFSKIRKKQNLFL
jgi:hypothetical protein